MQNTLEKIAPKSAEIEPPINLGAALSDVCLAERALTTNETSIRKGQRKMADKTDAGALIPSTWTQRAKDLASEHDALVRRLQAAAVNLFHARLLGANASHDRFDQLIYACGHALDDLALTGRLAPNTLMAEDAAIEEANDPDTLERAIETYIGRWVALTWAIEGIEGGGSSD